MKEARLLEVLAQAYGVVRPTRLEAEYLAEVLTCERHAREAIAVDHGETFPR